MYLELFKLHELPFRLTPDPQFLYLSKHHARAKAYMESTIWFTDGFVVITGEIGSGKTTLIETFLKELEKDVVVAQINQTQVSAIEFLQTVLVQFGFQPFRMKKAELLSTLNEFLVEQYANGRRVLLIVDEAQNLSNKVLEEIRLLSGVETTKEKVLRIILAGQPELNDKLELVDADPAGAAHPPALPPDRAVQDRHRSCTSSTAWKWPARRGGRFSIPKRYPLIFRYTGGIPRLVNTLCDTSMMAAFAQDRDVVKVEDMKAAIEELQWVEYAERSVKLHALPLCTHVHAHAPAPVDSPGRAARRARPHPGRLQRPDDRGARADARPLHHRPHARQRPADRQQVHQPSSRADHHVGRAPRCWRI